MQLKKNSFVAYVAYDNPLGTGPRVPTHTSICPLFWRFLFGLLIKWPIGVIVGVVLLTLASAVGLLLSHRIATTQESESYGKSFVPIKKWPTLRGWRLQPWWLIVAWVLWAKWPLLLEIFKLAVIPGMILVGVLLFSSATDNDHMSQSLKKSSIYQLVSGRLRAAKERVCPIVTFVE